jgi:hypothetical protein
MARVPDLPYRVVVHVEVARGKPWRTENHNYSTLPGAMEFRDMAFRKPLTRKVEVLMVLDVSTPAHQADTTPGKDRETIRAVRMA